MNRNHCQVYKMDRDSRDIVKDLMRFQKNIYKHRKKQENEYWIDVPERFLDGLEPHELDHFVEQHQNFTQSDGVALLRHFLATKYEANDEMIKKICDP